MPRVDNPQPSTYFRSLAASTRCLRLLPLLLCVLAVAARSPAQLLQSVPTLVAELPNAPNPQSAAEMASGSISGFITDSDGDSITEAHVTLNLDGQASTASRTVITPPQGRFSFSNIPSGPFSLSIAVTGFAPQQVSGVLHSGEALELPAITLRSASSTSVQVTATQADIANAQVAEEEKQRVLAFIPNFYVSYIPNPIPLSPSQKYKLALRTLVDPISLIFNGGLAGVQQAENTYAWGQGAQGYAKLYAAGFGNMLTGTLISNAALPILLKQDPRYYYKGTGSVSSRTFYALANAVICKGDNHHWQPNYSAILGSVASSGLSNLYYPAVNRDGAELTFENAAIGTGLSGVANLIQEFLIRKLTPHLPPRVPASGSTSK